MGDPPLTSRDPPLIKVICVGLGRTGTSSLRDALEYLGQGPCYHFTTIIEGGGKDFAVWSKIGTTLNERIFDSLFRGYSTLLDNPVAMNAPALYAAYPDAKFILTTRDPAKWEKSMKSTILWVNSALERMENRNELQEALYQWSKIHEQYHAGRLHTNTKQELLDHNERIKSLIPPDKLLVYDVSQGWKPLVKFLGLPTPDIPFPHVNDTADYQSTFFPMYTSVNEEPAAVYRVSSDPSQVAASISVVHPACQ